MRFPGFIGPSYQMPSKIFDAQRCVNLYPVLNELGTGKEDEKYMLVGRPGLSLLVAGSNPNRGIYLATTGMLYVVQGNTLYSVSTSWVKTALGTLLTSTGNVSMVDDGFNLIIVDNPNAYDYNFSGATFSQITDPNYLGASRVTFQNAYFCFNQVGTNNMFYADLPSGSATATITFNNAIVQEKEGLADEIVGHISVNNNLWVLGGQSTEIWYLTGQADPPFQDVQGALIEIGLAAEFSLAKTANTLFWLGSNVDGPGIVYMANGYTSQRISTFAVEYALKKYSTLSDCTAYTYQSGGHTFYVLNFPSGNATWVYDVSTQLWHERAYLDNGVMGRELPNYHAFFNGQHVVGDFSNGNLYSMSDSVYTDNDAAIQRLRSSPHISTGMMRNFYHSFQLDIEVGIGLDGAGQGTSPQAILQFSDDGGKTWSNELWAPIGQIGVYKNRCIWQKLGMARDRVFRVIVSDPVPVNIIGAEINFTRGVA